MSEITSPAPRENVAVAPAVENPAVVGEVGPAEGAGSIEERVLCLEPQPEQMAEVAAALYRALEAEETEGETVDSFVHEATRIVLNWIGQGLDDRVEAFVKALDGMLVTVGAPDAPLAGVRGSVRLTVKLLEVGRWAAVYLDTNNTVKHVGMLAGGRRATWRALMRWAYAEDRPFSIDDVREAGFYPKRVAGAYEALGSLAERGLIRMLSDEGGPVNQYELTPSGRLACHALFGREEAAQQKALDSERKGFLEEQKAIEHDREALRLYREGLESRQEALEREREELAKDRAAFEEEMQQRLARLLEMEAAAAERDVMVAD